MGSYPNAEGGAASGDEGDDKEIVILGRTVRWGKHGIEYEADAKHRQIILEYFGFDENTRGLSVNGDKEDKTCAGDEGEVRAGQGSEKEST